MCLEAQSLTLAEEVKRVLPDFGADPLVQVKVQPHLVAWDLCSSLQNQAKIHLTIAK